LRTVTSITLGISLLVFGAGSVALSGQGATVQTHIGHVLDSFNGTPMNMGLLPTAMAEAKTAAQHAGLAAKSTSLQMMQTHAGHVINAIDPTIVAQGPGAGYGVKKAAQGVAQHAGLAAMAADANAMVKTHSMHVTTAANNVVAMSDDIVAIAQKIRMSTSMDEAQKLAMEMQTKAEQLTTGVDADNNGQISWNKPEGALNQAQQHMMFMKMAAGS
jgi:tellurite resistance protein